MNVKQLKTLLEKVSDDAIVVKSGYDHSYERLDCHESTALYHQEENVFTEDYGEEITPEKEFGKRIKVLVFD